MSEETTEAVLGGGLEETAENTAQPTQENPKPPVDASTPQTSVDFNNEESYRAFLNTLPEDVRNSTVLQQNKDFTSLTDQLLNAQRAIGKKRLEAPSDDWTDDQYNDFYSKIRPENDEYLIPEEVKLPIEYGEDVAIPEITDDATQELVDFAGQLGLSQRQFDQLYTKWTQLSVDNHQLTQQDTATALRDYKIALETEWKDDFNKNIQAGREAYTALSQEIPELNDLMANPAVANHPGVLKLFSKLSSSISDTLPASGSNIPGDFSNTVQGIQGQIADLDMDNSELILSNPSQLKPNDRRKRELVLEKRAQLYQQLYPNKT